MAIDSHTDNHQNDEDAELQAALAMSMNDTQGVPDEDEDMEDLEEDDALQRALEMSMNEGNEDNNEDEEMMSAVLGSLPGVDKNDERIQKALEDMDKKKKDEKK
jgi:26S proteasome regulatory subunit N10